MDHVSFLRGKHAFKFGVETLFIRPFFGNYSKARGVFSFGDDPGGDAFNGSTPLEDFLAGVADTGVGGTALNGSPLRSLRQEDYSGFFEDSWHVKSHVTLNLGLRYDLFGYHQPKTLNGNAGLAAQNLRTDRIPVDHKDFGPRLGLAYLFISHDLKVVRALAHRLVVLRHGHVVEEGDADVVFANPREDYTRALMAAAFKLEVSSALIDTVE